MKINEAIVVDKDANVLTLDSDNSNVELKEEYKGEPVTKQSTNPNASTTLEIADIFSFNSDNIIPIKTDDLNQRAKRPAVSTLNSTKIKKILEIEHPEMVI